MNTKVKVKDVLRTILKDSAIIIINYIVIIGIVVLIFKPYDKWNQDKDEDNFDYFYHHKMELDYNRTKDNLVDLVDSIILFYAPTSELHGIVLVDLCDEYGIDVRFVLAQGLQESHYGTKGLAVKTNSVFNIYSYDSVKINNLDGRGKFNHPDRSVKPYLKLLRDNYIGKNRTELDLMQNFVDLNGKRYASSKTYEVSLRAKYDEINTPKFDSLMSDLQQKKLRLNR